MSTVRSRQTASLPYRDVTAYANGNAVVREAKKAGKDSIVWQESGGEAQNIDDCCFGASALLRARSCGAEKKVSDSMNQIPYTLRTLAGEEETRLGERLFRAGRVRIADTRGRTRHTVADELDSRRHCPYLGTIHLHLSSYNQAYERD